ncbi:hypothetical protein, partial [Paenimyroides viscosum]|uniref:hypothetical protein n=1 Tax=Paenimyroides viscosum TaxID=2488729 RepID=UPI001939D0C6
CIFELFEKLSGCVLHMQGTHNEIAPPIRKLGSSLHFISFRMTVFSLKSKKREAVASLFTSYISL